MKQRPFLWFLLLEIVLSLAIYRGALWGKSLLVPLDSGPSMMSKLRYAEPTNNGIPSNHYLIDLFTYDLPTQYTIYQAYRRGEVPWWDPYTYAGRPLLADTPVNGTDPLRIGTYLLLPFELAYNWVHILYSFLTGLSMLLLLRHWQLKDLPAVLLAVAYQFSSYFVLELTNPTLQPNFVLYPLLWLAWDSWWRKPRTVWLAAGVLAIAGMFYTGNPQSHTYVVLFAAVFLFSYAGLSMQSWRRLLPMVALSGILAAMLAAPVLAAQAELFARNVRPVGGTMKPAAFLSGLLSLSAIFPWLLGTFRTLDLSKICGETALSWHLYVGSAAFILAGFGACYRVENPTWRPVKRMAIAFVVIYFIVCSTPLLKLLYSRLAGLAVLSLLVLAGLGVESLWRQGKTYARTGWVLIACSTLLAVGLQLIAFVIYPKLFPLAQQFIEKKMATTSLDLAPALRSFQLRNLPHEISFQNPETLLAIGSLLLLGLICLLPRLRRHPLVLPALLILNLLPELFFYNRFLPNEPVEMWHSLRAGGPEQKKLCALLADKPLRLYQNVPGVHEMPICQQWAQVYHVRMVNGYTSLQPRNLLTLPTTEKERYRNQFADFVYESSERGAASGLLRTNTEPGTVVFQWRKPMDRKIDSRILSLNKVELVFGEGPAGVLLWTDTYYPGWRAQDGGTQLSLTAVSPCFSQIEIPAGARTITLQYEPTYLRLSLMVSAAGLLGLVLWCWGYSRLSKKTSFEVPAGCESRTVT